jgi:hypothetical protein
MKTGFIKPMLVILAPAIFSAILSLIKVVPAPPNQGFAPLLYLPICMFGIPFCILFAFQGKLWGWKLLAGLALAFVFPVVLFIAANPTWMPSGMSACEEIELRGSVIRYECVDSSSDDPGYHREFMVEGFKGWPLMRVVGE